MLKRNIKNTLPDLAFCCPTGKKKIHIGFHKRITKQKVAHCQSLLLERVRFERVRFKTQANALGKTELSPLSSTSSHIGRQLWVHRYDIWSAPRGKIY